MYEIGSRRSMSFTNGLKPIGIQFKDEKVEKSEEISNLIDIEYKKNYLY